MDRLTSRKNDLIRRFRLLGSEGKSRQAWGEFVCDGEKLLGEAVAHGAEITAVLWGGSPRLEVPCPAQYLVPPELLDYASPLKHSGGVLFTVRICPRPLTSPGRTLVLETVQDPGNLGTILRTANALDVDTVLLTGDCADPYHPKTVRAGMGAVFRQRFHEMERGQVRAFLSAHGLRLWGAALSDRAQDIRRVSLRHAAVAVGSEGRGLSREMLELCDGELIIPMNGQCESLNAAVAAAIILWELRRAGDGGETDRRKEGDGDGGF